MSGRGRRGPLSPPADTPVTVVVPLCNEEQGIALLLERLHAARTSLAGYAVRTIFVDDGSTDRTAELLESACTDRDDAVLLRHRENRGVAEAIMTGIRAAGTEIVCSIDADCSYDPADIESMVPLLEDAAMVTASPYHPDGRVEGVPWWRLFLSRNLSRLYSLTLGEKLYTWTSCFRVYRRSAVADLPLHHGDFRGIAELAIRLIRSGQRIVEFPAVLGTRAFGTSKMRVLRTARGHLGLLAKAVRARL